MSISERLRLMETEDFKKSFNHYQIKNKSSIKELSDFLDNIDTNKLYYKIGIQKNKKYKKEITEDTLTIKTITSLINKLTNINYNIIKPKVIELITKEYMVPLIIENLIEKAILHHIYIPLYVVVIKDIQSDIKYKLIIKNCDRHFNKFFHSKQTTKDSFYENLCAENKNIDNIIGLSILITHLEKEDIIQGYIHKVLDPFMETIVNVNDIEVFKMLISFYNISEIYYKEKGIPEKYKKKMIELKNKTTSSKIKFKIMDILGE